MLLFRDALRRISLYHSDLAINERRNRVTATPGRLGRLPARAPLRTVRESFPSYGSSPHKDSHDISGPAVPHSANRGRAAWQYRPAAALRCAPLRQQLQDASTDWRRSSFAFLGYGGSTGCPTISDQTDVGISSALPLALASSVFPMLRPLTRLAVRSVRSRGRTGLAAFPCSANFTG